MNFLTEDCWLVILPTFLKGLAQVWYEKQSKATWQSWPRLFVAMVEHFWTEVECENVHQLVENLGQLEGESARRYVDRATELLDRLTAMQPDNEVLRVGMTTYLVSCLTNGASNEFRLKLKYEEPTTMAQAQEIAQKVDKVLSDPASKKSFMPSFPHPSTHPYPSSSPRPLHHLSPPYSQRPHQDFPPPTMQPQLQSSFPQAPRPQPRPQAPFPQPHPQYFPFLPSCIQGSSHKWDY